MAEANTLTLKAINKLTGEIFEVDINPYDPESTAQCLLNIKAMAKELDNLERDVKQVAEDYMAENDFKPVDLTSVPYRWVYKAAQRKTYNPHVVMAHLDQDMLFTAGAITVANGALEKLMAELVRRNELPTEDSQAILGSVELKGTKPYVMLEKVSTGA